MRGRVFLRESPGENRDGEMAATTSSSQADTMWFRHPMWKGEGQAGNMGIDGLASSEENLQMTTRVGSRDDSDEIFNTTCSTV